MALAILGRVRWSYSTLLTWHDACRQHVNIGACYAVQRLGDKMSVAPADQAVPKSVAATARAPIAAGHATFSSQAVQQCCLEPIRSKSDPIPLPQGLPKHASLESQQLAVPPSGVVQRP